MTDDLTQRAREWLGQAHEWPAGADDVALLSAFAETVLAEERAARESAERERDEARRESDTFAGMTATANLEAVKYMKERDATNARAAMLERWCLAFLVEQSKHLNAAPRSARWSDVEFGEERYRMSLDRWELITKAAFEKAWRAAMKHIAEMKP